jgi:hypothetical protein
MRSLCVCVFKSKWYVCKSKWYVLWLQARKQMNHIGQHSTLSAMRFGKFIGCLRKRCGMAMRVTEAYSHSLGICIGTAMLLLNCPIVSGAALSMASTTSFVAAWKMCTNWCWNSGLMCDAVDPTVTCIRWLNVTIVTTSNIQ